MKRRVALFLVLALLAVSVEARRIVAVGDIHGGFDEATSVLRASGLVDENLDWVGGDAVLVQTGDVFDRGLRVDDVIALLQKLQQQAPEQGGEVRTLMGNHEGMNLLHITRDVNPEIYAHYASANSEQRRQKAYESWKKWSRQRARRLGQERPEFDAAIEQEWMAKHPPGYLEYVDALAPDGAIGSWLRSLPVTTDVDGALFVHGGYTPEMSGLSVEEINARVAEEVETFDRCRRVMLRERIVFETADALDMIEQGTVELRFLLDQLNQPLPPATANRYREQIEAIKDCVDFSDWYLVSPEGPLWTRLFAQWQEEEGTEQVAAMLAERDGRFFVVGHTPRADGRIQSRFGDRVFLIDTGMLQSHYEGQPAALEITEDAVAAIYGDSRQILVEPEPGEIRDVAEAQPGGAADVGASLYLAPDGSPLPFRNDQEVLDFLREAAVVRREVILTGVNESLKLLLERDGVQAHAVFRSVDWEERKYRTERGDFYPLMRDSYRYEVAAYRIDRLLELNRVPPVVLRKIDGSPGSVQIWIEGVITERERRERDLKPSDISYFSKQKAVMGLFDALILNVDRNQGNILVDPETWRQWWIDHTRSFLIDRKIQELKKIDRIERGLWERVETIDEDRLVAAVGEILSQAEMKGLAARWIQFQRHVEKLRAEVSEERLFYELVEPPTQLARSVP